MTLVGYKADNHPQQTAKRGAKDQVDDRGTDPAFIASLEERFGKFTLDVAAAPHNAKAPAYYTLRDNGLLMPWGTAVWQGDECFMCNGTGDHYASANTPIPGTPWTDGKRTVPTGHPCPACNGHGRFHDGDARPPERVWCNPPYSNIGDWVTKAWHEWTLARDQTALTRVRPELIVMLLPANRTEQKWWQEHVEPYRDRPGSDLRVEFLPGRMRFHRPNWTPGPKGDRPPFGCCLLIWQTAEEVAR